MSDPKSTVIGDVGRDLLRALAESLQRHVVAVHRAEAPRYVGLNALSFACALQAVGEGLTDDEAVAGFRDMLVQTRKLSERPGALTLTEIDLKPEAKA